MINKNSIWFFSGRKGSAFIVVVGVLGIIIFAASMFMTSSVEEGRQTNMSVRGLHAASLAEASLERAMSILSKNINTVQPDKAKKDDFGILLRLPGKEGGSGINTEGKLGNDKQLTLSSDAQKEIELTKDSLQADGNTELDTLVDYMTDNGAESYEVSVKVKISNAFRNSPGSSYDDFKVPGVDIPWNTRFDVKNFLEGNGYTFADIEFPSGWKWLNVSIPVEIMGIKITDINIVGILDNILEKRGTKIVIGGKERSLEEITTIDFLADALINQVIAKGKTPKPYPIKIPMDKVAMPKSVAELWPSGTSISEGEGQYLEKYGEISLEAEAKIKYKDGYVSSRRVSAVKDFKVADCEPPAPMYSFFINNLSNNYIAFNNYGGQFYVNNYDFSGIFGKIKNMVTGATVDADEANNKDFPGLVRVNYSDKTENKTAPLVCNVSMMGDPGVPTVLGDDSGNLKRIMGGMEACLIVCPKSKMAVVGSKYNIQSDIVEKNPETKTSVPVKIKGRESKDDKKVGFPFDKSKNYGLELKKPENKTRLETKFFKLENSLNLVPNVAKLSVNLLNFAVTMAVKPLGEAAIGALSFDQALTFPDCFQKWEMPEMGNSWSYYTLPTTGFGANKSHLFGYSGLHPTLTKEIEGNVMKSYRQWAMCIVGMKQIDRLPLLPFPPTFLPPFPIPVWKTSIILKKYGYNLDSLSAHDDTGGDDNSVHEYDPELVENMAPNLYTNEQYAKKATYYYEDEEAFKKDFPNRVTKIGDKDVFILKGITYISGSLGSDSGPFTLDGVTDTLYVAGKGMIVCSGNISLGFNIELVDKSEDEKTLFSLVCRNGGLLVLESGKQLKIEGSVYTDRGIYILSDSSLNIIGNWVTNEFNKATMNGTVVVDYTSSRLRSSLGSLHPSRGKYDPQRYYVTFSPVWSAWRSY